jgi:hypothetical protein
MNYKEKEEISQKIANFIADLLEAKKISLKEAGKITDFCISKIDRANSLEEFKVLFKKETASNLSPFINELIRIITK